MNEDRSVQALGAMVLIRAVMDGIGQFESGLSSGLMSAAHDSARAFFGPDDSDLEFWAGLVDLDPTAIREAFRAIQTSDERRAVVLDHLSRYRQLASRTPLANASGMH